MNGITTEVAAPTQPVQQSLPIASANPVSMKSESEPAISAYTDFRKYLSDVYEFRRSNEGTGLRPYGYSTFSAAADIKSPNYLKLIIDGRRNLSEEMMTRFARALRLDKSGAEEFRALVRYGQAADPLQRNHFLKILSDFRAKRAFEAGDIKQVAWEKVPGWIGWVLYAMAEQSGVEFDPAKLQQLIRTRTGIEDLRDSLDKLIASGELEKNADTGEMQKSPSPSDTAQDLPIPLIRKLQTELIYLGIESLYRDSAMEREFGALTMAMTEEEFQLVRFELRQLRKRLQRDLTVKRKDQKGDRVYQLNIQLFPITDKV